MMAPIARTEARLAHPIKATLMNFRAAPRRSVVANVVYGLLNPIPFGIFVAALIFDIIYARSANVLWVKSAAWLIAMGLLFAVIPRLINLVQVCVTARRFALSTEKLDFWLNVLAIIAAIFNAFVHSRDAYGAIPEGVWLSVITVTLMAIGRIATAAQDAASGNIVHD